MKFSENILLKIILKVTIKKCFVLSLKNHSGSWPPSLCRVKTKKMFLWLMEKYVRMSKLDQNLVSSNNELARFLVNE